MLYIGGLSTTRNVLPSFRVDIQSKEVFTLILKDFLLCIENQIKIQIIVSGCCLDVPNNKTRERAAFLAG